MSEDQLLTSNQWAKLGDIKILDPDGWRTNVIFGQEFQPCNFHTTKITESEFTARCTISTTMRPGRKKS